MPGCNRQFIYRSQYASFRYIVHGSYLLIGTTIHRCKCCPERTGFIK